MQSTWRLGAVLRLAVRKPQFWFGAVWIIPTLVYYGLFLVGPVVRALPIALTQYNLAFPSKSVYVGLGNYRTLFNQPYYLVSIRNTLVWAGLMFLLMLPLALAFSVMLTRLQRGRNFYQALAYLPVVVSMVAVSLLFTMLLDPSTGAVNEVLSRLHLPTSKFLTDQSSALPTVAVIAAWKGLGFYIVVLTAGLLGIPEEIYDAARVDGANEWQCFWRVSLPLLTNTLMLVSVLLAIGALQEFTGVFVMTGGGPGTATMMYNLLIYQEAFSYMRFGTASAAALLQFVVILGVSYLQIRLLRPQWSY